MGLFGRIRNAAALPGDSVSNPSGWLGRLLTGAATSSGVVISEENALTVSDVYKCVRVISETIAMLPWKVYKRSEDDGRKTLVDHPLYRILHDEPNDHMTSFTYRETVMAHLLLRGKHYSYIERGADGRVVALWPLLPHRCRFEVRNGQMWFYASTQSGPEVKFFPDEILYIPGLTRDGYNAYSPIELHRETLGLSKAAELFGGKFFGNGSNSGGFLKHPNKLSPEAAQRLKKSWEERNSGIEAAHRVTVLEEGMEFTANTIPPDQAQFLQTRKFQRSEIAGLFRVPPHKIGDLERSTNNNIEHQDLEFLRDCIAPWLERIEQSGNRCLLLPREKGKIYIEFEIKGMMRGDTAARTAFYAAMFATGAYSPNMILKSENENPVEGGDQRFVPMAMVPLDKAAELAASRGKQSATREGDGQSAPSKATQRFFRDVVGRVANRKPEERSKYAENALRQPVLAILEEVLGPVSEQIEQFAGVYSGQLAARTATWDADRADAIASEEMEKAVRAAIARGSN